MRLLRLNASLVVSISFCWAQSNTGKLISVPAEATRALRVFTFATPYNIAGLNAEALAPTLNTGNYIQLGLAPVARPANVSIATQLSSLPLASPAAGVVFREDALGIALPSAQSLGPILTERAETLGKGAVSLSFGRQQFRFKEIEGVNIGDMRLLDLGGQPSNISIGGVRQDTPPAAIGAQLALGLDQNVALVTYGLTERIDISAALRGCGPA